jgi:hypothetical protein
MQFPVWTIAMIQRWSARRRSEGDGHYRCEGSGWTESTVCPSSEAPVSRLINTVTALLRHLGAAFRHSVHPRRAISRTTQLKHLWQRPEQRAFARLPRMDAVRIWRAATGLRCTFGLRDLCDGE